MAVHPRGHPPPPVAGSEAPGADVPKGTEGSQTSPTPPPGADTPAWAAAEGRAGKGGSASGLTRSLRRSLTYHGGGGGGGSRGESRGGRGGARARTRRSSAPRQLSAPRGCQPTDASRGGQLAAGCACAGRGEGRVAGVSGPCGYRSSRLFTPPSSPRVTASPPRPVLITIR